MAFNSPGIKGIGGQKLDGKLEASCTRKERANLLFQILHRGPPMSSWSYCVWRWAKETRCPSSITACRLDLWTTLFRTCFRRQKVAARGAGRGAWWFRPTRRRSTSRGSSPDLPPVPPSSISAAPPSNFSKAKELGYCVTAFHRRRLCRVPPRSLAENCCTRYVRFVFWRRWWQWLSRKCILRWRSSSVLYSRQWIKLFEDLYVWVELFLGKDFQYTALCVYFGVMFLMSEPFIVRELNERKLLGDKHDWLPVLLLTVLLRLHSWSCVPTITVSPNSC